MPTPLSHKTPLLSGRFRFAEQNVLGGHARLYADRIELDGWQLSGRVRRRISLLQILDLTYHPVEEGGNLSLFLDDGEELKLVVQNAHQWRLAFENWLSYHVLASAKIMPEQDQVHAIAG